MASTQTSLAAPETTAAEALADLTLDVFRLNGALLSAGDALVGGLGLTSARWQVLGAVALAPVPLPVASLARTMGLTRQAVQRLVDEMKVDGWVRLAPNLHHRRALLVVTTPEGEAVYRAASERQRIWAVALTAGLPPGRIRAASDLLRQLRRSLDAADDIASVLSGQNERKDSNDAELHRDGQDRNPRRSAQGG